MPDRVIQGIEVYIMPADADESGYRNCWFHVATQYSLTILTLPCECGAVKLLVAFAAYRPLDDDRGYSVSGIYLIFAVVYVINQFITGIYFVNSVNTGCRTGTKVQIASGH
jgi:hypothetical protein